MFTTNVMLTDPPPGIKNVPHAGVPDPAVGFDVDVCTAFPDRLIELVDAYVKPPGKVSEMLIPEAPPAPAALLTAIVYVAVPPRYAIGVEVVLTVVNETGTQFAPEMETGILDDVTVVAVPAPPPVAP